jgi:hypothetical protein
MPNHPPRIETEPLPPIPPGLTPLPCRDVDRVANTGFILAALGAFLVMLVLIMWAGSSDRQTANNQPAITSRDR